jgi:hypothetical protein
LATRHAGRLPTLSEFIIALDKDEDILRKVMNKWVWLAEGSGPVTKGYHRINYEDGTIRLIGRENGEINSVLPHEKAHVDEGHGIVPVGSQYVSVQIGNFGHDDPRFGHRLKIGGIMPEKHAYLVAVFHSNVQSTNVSDAEAASLLRMTPTAGTSYDPILRPRTNVIGREIIGTNQVTIFGGQHASSTDARILAEECHGCFPSLGDIIRTLGKNPGLYKKLIGFAFPLGGEIPEIENGYCKIDHQNATIESITEDHWSVLLPADRARFKGYSGREKNEPWISFYDRREGFTLNKTPNRILFNAVAVVTQVSGSVGSEPASSAAGKLNRM